jgi:NifU-like protein
MWEYTEKVKEHFFNPRNVGSIDAPDGVGEVGSLACGDALKLYLKIDTETDRILDAKFQTFGCGSAIASSSALTEMVIGKTLEEALNVSNQDIAEFLGGLPKEKMHCSVMGRDALHAAVANYRGEPPPKETHEGEVVVCECFGITDEQIRREVRENRLTTIEEVTNYTKAGGGCGRCHESIEAIIAEVTGKLKEENAPEPPAVKPMTNIQKIAKIQEVLEKEIRPMLQKDGGDIELVDLEGNKVLVAMRGTCASCPVSDVTLKDGIETKIRELVHPELVVEEVAA